MSSVMAREAARRTPKTAELEAYLRKYPDVHREVIVKEDILNCGFKYTDAALERAAGAQTKMYHLFSYDRITVADMHKRESTRVPEEIRLRGGQYGLRPLIVHSRINDKTPYTVDVVDGKLAFLADGEIIGEVEYAPRPAYYDMTFPDKTQYAEIVPLTWFGYFAFLTCLRNCQYWGDKEECKFCDINANVRQQKESGRQYTVHKKVDQILEVLKRIFFERPENELRTHTLILTGGTIVRTVQKADDIDFYLHYVEPIKALLGNRWCMQLQTAAKARPELERLKAAGVNSHQANIEVWDARLWKILCPGKESFVGRDEWIKRVIDSVNVFGEGYVYPNFVAGVEMAKPWGFEDVDQAVKSTASGFDYLMAHGVMPRMNHWTVEPLSPLGGQEPPPLDYYIKMDLAWYELFCKHRLPFANGLGPMGPGKSVNANSAFQDMGEC